MVLVEVVPEVLGEGWGWTFYGRQRCFEIVFLRGALLGGSSQLVSIVSNPHLQAISAIWKGNNPS